MTSGRLSSWDGKTRFAPHPQSVVMLWMQPRAGLRSADSEDLTHHQGNRRDIPGVREPRGEVVCPHLLLCLRNVGCYASAAFSEQRQRRPDLIGLRGGECHSLLVCHLFPVTLGVTPQDLGALANLVLPWAMGCEILTPTLGDRGGVGGSPTSARWNLKVGVARAREGVVSEGVTMEGVARALAAQEPCFHISAMGP